MSKRPEDICPRPHELPPQATTPHAAPIYLSSVYRCETPDQAERLLSKAEPGWIYARDGHPNAGLLADKCRELHQVERAAITASGMAALATALLSQCASGDHVVVSNLLYGSNIELLTSEAARLGIDSSVVDTCDLKRTEEAITSRTKLLAVETITNPLLRVSDLAGLANLTRRHNVALLVDNTFASPAICRPAEFGADLVLESLTKIMNGHSDVVLGMLGGRESVWQRVDRVLSKWGLASSPFDCWLALRGIGTLALRARAASENALAVAEFLAGRAEVAQVHYPGLPLHPDHALAARQFGGRFGSMVAFTLAGGRPAAEQFIARSVDIPFCPSLGELSTTLSHPESTSHRGLTPAVRSALGIEGGTIRLSVGIESQGEIIERLTAGLHPS